MIDLLEILDEPEMQKIIMDHLNTFGYDAQMLQLAEECNELSQACIKIIKKRTISKDQEISSNDYSNWIDEFVDVVIMLAQMSSYLDGSYDHIVLRFKMNRAKDRLAKYVEGKGFS